MSATLAISAATFALFGLTLIGCMVLAGSRRMHRDLAEANKDPVSPCFMDTLPKARQVPETLVI